MKPGLTFVAILEELGNNKFNRLPILRRLYEARTLIYKPDVQALIETKLLNLYLHLESLYQEGDGDGNAIALLAYFYQFGIKVDQDYDRARQLCDKALQQDNAFALSNLAVMYFHGHGLKKNIKQAISMLKQASEQGCMNAAYTLGKLYLRGIGVEEDFDTAVSLMSFAIENEYTPAMTLLAHQYAMGINTKKSIPAAIMLLKQAIKLGDGEAMNKLGMIYKARAYQHYRSQNSVEGLACYQKAIKKYKQAANFGNGIGMYNFALTTKYLNKKQRRGSDSIIRLEVTYNDTYFTYLKKASKLGIVEASYPLAKAYRDGKGCVADPTKALKHFLIAADDGNVDAMVQVAESYAAGNGCDKDLAKTLAYYHKAAKKGEQFALFQLTDYYEKGLGTEMNLAKAIKFFEDSFRIQCKINPFLPWSPLSMPTYPMNIYQIPSDAFKIDHLLDVLWPDLLTGKTFSKNTAQLLKGLGQPSIVKRLRETFRPYSNLSNQAKLFIILTNRKHGLYQCLTTETRKLIQQEVDYLVTIRTMLSLKSEQNTLPLELNEHILGFVQSPPIAKMSPKQSSNRMHFFSNFFRSNQQSPSPGHSRTNDTWIKSYLSFSPKLILGLTTALLVLFCLALAVQNSNPLSEVAYPK